MRVTRFVMGMPATIEIAEASATERDVDPVFDLLKHVDEQFSPFKPNSEVSRYGRRELSDTQISPELRHILEESEKTKRATNGFFDIWAGGIFNPSGYVKGWAIQQAADLLLQAGWKNIYVEIAGDIQVYGQPEPERSWRIGIRHPFQPGAITKVVQLTDAAIATSGTYERGEHILDPHSGQPVVTNIVSLSVIAPSIIDADRFATAAFAMGDDAIHFIEQQPHLEGYAIDLHGVATMTSGFHHYLTDHVLA